MYYNFENLIEENPNVIYRYCVYRKPGLWTPYEMEEKFIDESFFEDGHYTFAKITDCIHLDGDLLIEFNVCDEEDYEPIGRKEYRLLSNIQLDRFERDNEKRE